MAANPMDIFLPIFILLNIPDKPPDKPWAGVGVNAETDIFFPLLTDLVKLKAGS